MLLASTTPKRNVKKGTLRAPNPAQKVPYTAKLNQEPEQIPRR
jgi:hypothetical protein